MHFFYTILLILITQINAVKIGVSKIDTSTPSTTIVPATAPSGTPTTTTIISTTTTISTTSEAISSTPTTPNLNDEAITAELPEEDPVTEDSITTTTITENDAEFPVFPPVIFRKKTTKKLTTTTPIPETTTTPITIATTLMPIDSIEFNSTIDINRIDFRKYFCYCNLLENACDINCCCDPDCSKEALKVFDCNAEAQYTELRTRLEDFQYQHGLPSCKINDGWLCVFRTNIHPEKEKILLSDFNTDRFYKWPTSPLQLIESEKESKIEFYKYGEPLKVFNEQTLEIENFVLPYDYKPPYCYIQEPIKYLQSFKRNCLYVDSKEHSKAIGRFLNSTSTFKLLTQPNANNLNEPTNNHLIDIQIKKCIQNEDKTEDCCSEEFDLEKIRNDSLNGDCIINGITLKIWHNYTNILNALVAVHLQKNISLKPATELWLEYETIFLYHDATESNSKSQEKLLSQRKREYSGPLGYLQGEPVIISRFIANNQSQDVSESNRVLNYFHESSIFNDTIHLFSRSNGRCHKTYEKENALKFGVNEMKQCTVHLEKIIYSETLEKKKEKHYNNICLHIQGLVIRNLFDFLNDSMDLHELSLYYISVLGHPKNSSDKWLPIQAKNAESLSITGQFDENSKTFICHGILLSAAYEFHIVTHAEDGIAHQSLIRNAVVSLGQRHDVAFSLDEEFEVPIFMTVRFYDSTSDVINGCSINSFQFLTILQFIIFTILTI